MADAKHNQGPFDNLSVAARCIMVGYEGSFTAMHEDPLYNAGEGLALSRFDVVRNDDEELVVTRQYRPGRYIYLTEYRTVAHDLFKATA